jgi:phage baseplate assembly protein W
MASTLKKIYSDLDLTFKRVPGTNDVALRYDENAVIASVRNLLLTNFYERPFQPDVGSNLNRLLFEPATEVTASILDTEIRNTIKNYEPRVAIDELEITLNEDGNSFLVYLSFYVGNNSVPTAVNLILQRSR